MMNAKVTKRDLLRHQFQEVYLLKDAADVEPLAAARLQYEVPKTRSGPIGDFFFLRPGTANNGDAIQGVNTTRHLLTAEHLEEMFIRDGKLFMVWTPDE